MRNAASRARFSGACLAALLTLLAACDRSGDAPKPAAAPAEPPADIVFRGGAVYTVDASRTIAEAAAVRGGHIVAVGSAADVAPLVGPQTEVVELDGGMLLP